VPPFSHLTCTSTKSNLRLPNSLATVSYEPILQGFLTFHVPNLMSIFRCLEGLLAPAQSPSWRTTRCRLSATAYSVYLQLRSISGCRLLHPQPVDAPCRGDKVPLNMARTGLYVTKLLGIYHVQCSYFLLYSIVASVNTVVNLTVP
jgi:hypothetical protein